MEPGAIDYLKQKTDLPSRAAFETVAPVARYLCLLLDGSMSPHKVLHSAGSSMRTNNPFRRKRIRSNSTSSVFATETVLQSNDKRTLYYIAYILQADIFEEAADGCQQNPHAEAALNISPTLPVERGGDVSPQDIPFEVLMNETANDLELRQYIQNGSVPTVDTIFRFLCWIFDSTQVSSPCNLASFLYWKRLKPACIFTTLNWRGLWVGCILLAQKLYDDHSLLTSHFAAILPSVSKWQLKALEFRVFTLLNFDTYIKPTIYMQAYYNLRALFKAVLNETLSDQRDRPLTTDSPLTATGTARALLRKLRSHSLDEPTRYSTALLVLS